MKTFAVIILFMMILVSAPSRAVSLNDFSILLPLPQAPEMPLLFSPFDEGDQGALLSRDVFKKMNPLLHDEKDVNVWNNQLKVIALRIDPCFIEGEGPLPCRHQVRLIWQPIVFKDGKALARDAALHSFYEFDEPTFQQIKKSWFQVSQGQPSEDLQVQPQIFRESLHGIYWQNLRQVILKYCGEKTLVRMTSMNVMSGEQIWVFAGFDIQGAQFWPMKVSRTNVRAQGMISGSSAFRSFTGGMMPAPAADPEFGEFLKDSSAFQKNYSEDQVKALIGKVQGYENPLTHNTGTLDCASCHMADATHQWAQLNYKNWNWQRDFQGQAYQSAWSLKNTSPGPLRTNQLRAFGYFMAWPAISQRVINETAHAAESF